MTNGGRGPGCNTRGRVESGASSSAQSPVPPSLPSVPSSFTPLPGPVESSPASQSPTAPGSGWGSAMRLGRMWNGDKPVRRSARGADQRGSLWRPKPGLSIGPWRRHRGDRGPQHMRWFAGFCNSHQVSHFAAFFIDARAEISVAKSRFGYR
ncbi:hypothetical protein JCGZ_01322 [Jatropha curcas]|uniref:Uncharacterized protein n=1 Tax=Jatropha curcas TaxID=180498 RepID=A0A067L8V2_JATCU|nr:hypothetical protein JCGZ_01322 [Jatropha curcas]